MRLFILILLLCTIPAVAAAQEADESEYTDYYFGTRVLITTSTSVAEQNRAYWGEMLPQEYMYGQAALVKIINDARRAEGRDDLLDVANYPVMLGVDRKLEEGSWEYAIEFRGSTPSEAQLVLDELGLGPAFEGADIGFEPMKIAYFSNYANEIEAIQLDLPGGTVMIDPAQSVNSHFAEIEAVLAEKYGDNFVAEIYYNAGKSVMGPDSSSISVTVYLDGAESTMDMGYYDY